MQIFFPVAFQDGTVSLSSLLELVVLIVSRILVGHVVIHKYLMAY